jgi:hypothetical protein
VTIRILSGRGFPISGPPVVPRYYSRAAGSFNAQCVRFREQQPRRQHEARIEDHARKSPQISLAHHLGVLRIGLDAPDSSARGVAQAVVEVDLSDCCLDSDLELWAIKLLATCLLIMWHAMLNAGTNYVS